jgi:hypothetical protein
MPASIATQIGRLSPVRFVYAAFTAMGVSAVAEVPADCAALEIGGVVAPPQAAKSRVPATMSVTILRILFPL